MCWKKKGQSWEQYYWQKVEIVQRLRESFKSFGYNIIFIQASISIVENADNKPSCLFKTCTQHTSDWQERYNQISTPQQKSEILYITIFKIANSRILWKITSNLKSNFS